MNFIQVCVKINKKRGGLKMLADNLKYLRLKHGFSQDYIAKILNKKSFTTVQKWESGVSDPPLWAIGKLSELYGESMDNLWNADLEQRDLNKKLGIKSYADSFEYCDIPSGIAAGALEKIDGMQDIPKISIPDAWLGKYARNRDIVFMHVNGESMNKIIQNGATIAVLMNINLDTIHNGDVVVAQNCHGEYTVKHFYDDEDNDRFILRPDSSDPSFTDMIFNYDDADEMKIFGKVVIYSVYL